MNNINSKIKYAESKIAYFLTKLKQYLIIILAVSIACGTAGGVITMITYSPIYTVTQAFTIELKNNPGANQAIIKDSQLSKTVPALLSSDTFMDYMEPIIKESGTSGRFRVSSLSNTNIFYLTIESKSNKNAIAIIELIRDNYSALANKIIGESEMVLMSTPSTSNLPSNSPNYIRNAVLGFIIGLVVTLGMLVLKTLTTKTITDEYSTEQLLNSKCLATIDEVKVKKRSADKNEKGMPLITSDDASLELKQSINRLTTKIVEQNRKNGTKIIMMTSTISGEGKTSICVNLACNLADIGKRVLIIDCDMRAPNVHFYLQPKDLGASLSNAIANPKNTKNLIVNTNTPNLMLLGNDNGDENASTIANSSNIKTIINEIEQEYDFIILDTPPVGFLGDGISISDAADGFVYVISHNYVNSNYVLRSLDGFNGSNAKMLGFVINHKQ